MELKEKKVLIVGMGKSGEAALRYCSARGAIVTVTDSDGARKLFENADLVVASPGVPWKDKNLKAARAKGIPVFNELELALTDASLWRANPKLQIIAVPGTNGKSTTVSLIHHILQSVGKKSLLAGNIGRPLLDAVADLKKSEILVLEVSSFQIVGAPSLRPDVSILLNVSENHLDWHASFKEYKTTKEKLLAQTKPTGKSLAYCDDKIAAAQFAVAPYCADKKKIQKAIKTFQPLPHRLQAIAVKNGVTYMNDSKATTVTAVIYALETMNGSKVLWLAGGRDKNLNFKPLAPVARKKVRKAFLFGEAKEKIKKALTGTKTVLVENLKEALTQASREAKKGETVLLSPACASFDQFKNFEERGEAFTNLVRNMK
ncbi:MAG: UDP-N-acetylmuramoyl-L-alanine--D-glutamate ligase [Deltaproteobacteria bacterium]|nr:UDP-N-acetylmuramoyl-L-alanine--D-glutamate ligase [Deltaproteobacteria bacterium]